MNIIKKILKPFTKGEWLYKMMIYSGSRDESLDKQGAIYMGHINDAHVYGECSYCGKRRIVDNYCSNCGKKMKDVIK